MKSAELHPQESLRTETLDSYGILDSEIDLSLQAIVERACALTGTPISLVSLVDRDRQWFMARKGLEVQETARSVSFCAHAILGSDVFVVPDAHADARFL